MAPRSMRLNVVQDLVIWILGILQESQLLQNITPFCLECHKIQIVCGCSRIDIKYGNETVTIFTGKPKWTVLIGSSRRKDAAGESRVENFGLAYDSSFHCNALDKWQ